MNRSGIFTAFVILLVFLLASVFLGAVLVSAQDATAVFPTAESFETATALAEPTITPTPVIVQPPPPDPVTEEPGDPPATTPENLLGQLFSLLKDATFIVWAAAGVIVIVGAIKTVLGAIGIRIEGNLAVIITLIVQVLIWLGYTVANYVGQGETFKAFYLQVVDVIRSLLPLFGAIFLGHIGYQAAAARKIPVLGYKAPPKPAR